ncbi:MAG: single-stranded DNA-binding protein [Candidatus Meridianibacter frigidus]|nr:MAG: single-stranded DNA-binding protein [Candidatus Eremiobacteraeota bacterium]
MAGSFNKVILVGNLVRDPEIRYVGSGAAVTKFTLAVNRRSKQQEETDFVDIVAWEKLAETCNTYLKKGMSCLIEGRLSIRSYEDKEGQKRKATEVVINTMQMLDRAPRREGFDEAAAGADHFATAGARAGTAPAGDIDPLDDEIPF